MVLQGSLTSGEYFQAPLTTGFVMWLALANRTWAELRYTECELFQKQHVTVVRADCYISRNLAGHLLNCLLLNIICYCGNSKYYKSGLLFPHSWCQRSVIVSPKSWPSFNLEPGIKENWWSGAKAASSGSYLLGKKHNLCCKSLNTMYQKLTDTLCWCY